MQLSDKKILLISPESWGTNFISKHHYAHALSARNNQVFFLNPPSNSFKQLDISHGLIVVDYKARFKGLRMLPGFVNAQLIKYEVLHLERKLNTTFDIIWNFDSSRFFNLSEIKKKFKICHIVDMAENIAREKLASSSDICLCTSQFIGDELMPFNSNTFIIHHGYNLNHETVNPAEEFSNRIHVGYVGNLARKSIDWELIFSLIKTYPNIVFNFIGNYEQSNLSREALDLNMLNELKCMSNVRLLGEKNSALIPSYLKRFDILLSAYKISDIHDIKQHSNLHKTMEYLGSGKIIVSNYSEEYKSEQHLLEMVNPGESFEKKFQQVVNNLENFNSKEKQEQRIRFANENSYENQLNRIEQICKEVNVNK